MIKMKSNTASALLITMIASWWATPANAEPFKAPALMTMTIHGPVFTTPQGNTLYWWVRANATVAESRCDNARPTSYRHVTSQKVYLLQPQKRKTCEEKWPPFVAPNEAEPTGKWSVQQRHDGSRQWVYDGHALHLSVKDTQAGQVNGIGVKARNYGGWRPALAPVNLPPGIRLLPLRQGLVLATDDSRVLYSLNSDHTPCADCNNTPTPLVAGALVNPVGEWTTVTTSSGQRQYAFRQQPVFIGTHTITGSQPPKLEGWQPVYFSLNPPAPSAIDIRFSLIGDIFTTKKGMSLYVFDCGEGPNAVPCDDPGDAAAHWSILCGLPEPCSQRWKPYLADPTAEVSAEWSIKVVPHPVFTDPKGTTYAHDNDNPKVHAWAYRGRPVYTFADDDEPAQLLGHRLKGLPGSGFYAIPAPGNNDKTMSR